MSYEKARSLLSKSVSRPTLYSVEIPPLSRSVNDFIKLFCIEATIPEIRHESAVVLGQSAMGVMREQPSAVRFGGPIDLKVIENSDFQIYKNMRGLYDLTAQGSNPSSFSSQNQRMRYYDDYVFELTVTKLEYPDGGGGMSGNLVDSPYRQVETFTFTNSYLTRISPLQFNSANQDSYTSFDVSFNFETYSTTNSAASLGSFSIPNGIGSFFKNVL